MKNPLRQSPKESFNERVKVIKPLLPKNLRAIIYANFPKYNTPSGAILINNVLMGRSSDVALTQILEQIARSNSSFQVQLPDAIKEQTEKLF